MIERYRGTWDKSKFVGGKSKGQEWEEVVPFSRVCAKVKFEGQDVWRVDLKLGKTWDQLQSLIKHVDSQKAGHRKK